MSYPVYPEVKASGVEWLGDLPKKWHLKRLKHCTRVVDEKLDAVPAKARYVGLENIESHTGRLFFHDQQKPGEGACLVFHAGDVLFGKLRPYLAKATIAETDGVCTTEILPLRPHGVDNRFLLYYLLSDNVIKVIDSSTYGVKMPRASWDFIGDLPQALPPLPEQQQIAAFLDRKTAELDAVLAQKERQLELLAEKRRALISQAVTRGLDPTAPLRPSGIPWLGEVPGHWEMKRLKYVASLQTGLTLGKDYKHRDTVTRPYLRVANVQDGFLDLASVTEVKIPAEEVSGYELRDGDVLMTEGGDFDKLGRGHVWGGEIEGCLHQNHIFAVRPTQNRLASLFLTSLMTSGYGKTYFTSTSQQTTNLATTNSTKLKDFPLPLPPLHEQHAIVTYIGRETARMDGIAQAVRAQIEKVREYRQALVSAAVTGKIDVRAM